MIRERIRDGGESGEVGMWTACGLSDGLGFRWWLWLAAGVSGRGGCCPSGWLAGRAVVDSVWGMTLTMSAG
jgi:hypothetical protein